MRKIIIYFAVFLSILFPLSAADSSEASFEILAYRVGGEGEGPYFYVVDALSSSLQNLASGTVKDMTSYVSSFLGNSSTSADVDYLGSVILSFRVEGSALGTYYVSATVTDFALTSENELENTSTIKGRYAFDNFDIIMLHLNLYNSSI